MPSGAFLPSRFEPHVANFGHDMSFVINPPNALGRFRNANHTDFRSRNGQGRSYTTFHFLVIRKAPSKHKTGCQPVLCMDKVGNRIRSKNDSERTIVRFFLFREKVDFSPEKSPHDRPSTGRPPSGQPEGTRPSWGWGTSRIFPCTWGSSPPHHCQIVLPSP